MERVGRLDHGAVGALDSEALVTSEPEVLFLLALAATARLLQPHLMQLVVRSDPPRDLTRRETDVLVWVAAGKTNTEIAELLSIAPGTVKKHLDHIYEKLCVGTRTEAVVEAMGIHHFRLP